MKGIKVLSFSSDVIKLCVNRCYTAIYATFHFGICKRQNFKPVLFAISTALVLKLFFFDFIIAQGHSMEPAIRDGSVLVVSRISYGLQLPSNKYLLRWSEPKKGEVVVFYTPTGELAVKRCIMPAENGMFYAEGDNSIVSYDSRSYGPILTDNIIGKVLGY